MTLDATVLAAIVGMAAVTYLTRTGGYWLLRRVVLGVRARRALEALPGAVLTALVTPVALASGPAESAATLLTFFAARRLPLIVAVAVGVASAALLRRLLAL